MKVTIDYGHPSTAPEVSSFLAKVNASIQKAWSSLPPEIRWMVEYGHIKTGINQGEAYVRIKLSREYPGLRDKKEQWETEKFFIVQNRYIPPESETLERDIAMRTRILILDTIKEFAGCLEDEFKELKRMLTEEKVEELNI